MADSIVLFRDVPLRAVDLGDQSYALQTYPTAINDELTLLESAARTATTACADQTNHAARGVIVFLNVSAASGSGGLTLRIQVKDPVSDSYVNHNAAPTAVTATGTTTYIFYPGSPAGGTQNTSSPLPRTWRVNVTHGDGSSYTYSVGACLIP